MKRLIVRYDGSAQTNLPTILEKLADQLREGYIKGVTSAGAKWWIEDEKVGEG